MEAEEGRNWLDEPIELFVPLLPLFAACALFLRFRRNNAIDTFLLVFVACFHKNHPSHVRRILPGKDAHNEPAE